MVAGFIAGFAVGFAVAITIITLLFNDHIRHMTCDDLVLWQWEDRGRMRER